MLEIRCIVYRCFFIGGFQFHYDWPKSVVATDSIVMILGNSSVAYFAMRWSSRKAMPSSDRNVSVVSGVRENVTCVALPAGSVLTFVLMQPACVPSGDRWRR